MSLALRLTLIFLALSLSLISPGLVQSQSIPNPPNSSEINDLAAELARAASEEEQERLLAQKNKLINSSLLAALKELIRPRVQKGDYVQALRVSQLMARIAERIGDQEGLVDAWTLLGSIHLNQNNAAQALDYFQKSLALHESIGDKKGMASALYNIGFAHRSQGSHDQSLKYFNRSLAISLESGNKNLMPVTLYNIGLIHRLQGRNE